MLQIWYGCSWTSENLLPRLGFKTQTIQAPSLVLYWLCCQLTHYNCYLLTSRGHQVFYQKQRYTSTVMLIVASDPVLCFDYVVCSIFSGIFNVTKVLRFSLLYRACCFKTPWQGFTQEHRTHTQMDCNDIWLQTAQFCNECISEDLNLVTWQSTVHGPPEDGLKNGTETCRGKFSSVFNVNFSTF